MERVLKAFGRSIVSQLHPKMLGLLVLPFVVSLLFWILTAWLVWSPLTDWLAAAIFDGWLSGVYGWAQGAGLGGIRDWIPALIALLLVVPASWVTAVAIVAIFAMPLVMRFLATRDYPSVARRGTGSPLPGIWNLLLAIPLFAIGYLLTLPLWLIPPLALVVPWFWWSWLTARVMRLDSLVEFAAPDERRALEQRYRREYLLLAMVVSALNLIPPLFLVTPVLSALAFGHYSLARLDERRAAPLPQAANP
ncbi:EI24 domain-containing protein [Burkholderiaceae bacterium FT117]|uniref:EI24 domain-containing protein n=1 Tax=Zeimonas sediminis TaxID=2944268 RepID=UPI002342F40B|nr:EI24 domain-containing protein [Zeimonas sediminis]MCM5569765.1 EI24 domain-containing protein [Zeimonas sediminis]